MEIVEYTKVSGSTQVPTYKCTYARYCRGIEYWYFIVFSISARKKVRDPSHPDSKTSLIFHIYLKYWYFTSSTFRQLAFRHAFRYEC